MKMEPNLARFGMTALVACNSTIFSAPADTNSVPLADPHGGPQSHDWNWHIQNTDIAQGYPGFSALYSGPNSLASGGQIRESVSLDLFAGVRLWRGAEAHIDGLVWQGFGLGKTLGLEGFPNGEAFRLGNSVPNVNIARLFICQTIGPGRRAGRC
jgi:high affinity Mn2+ porin